MGYLTATKIRHDTLVQSRREHEMNRRYAEMVLEPLIKRTLEILKEQDIVRPPCDPSR